MRILTCVLMLLVASAPALADPKMSPEDLSKAFAKAFNARDVNAVVALYTKEARVIWPGQGEEANGTEQIRRLVTKGFREAPKDARLIFESQEVIPLGDKKVAVLGHWQQAFTASDGKKVTVDIRTSEILVRHDDKLRYMVDHASVGLPPAPPPARPGTTIRR